MRLRGSSRPGRQRRRHRFGFLLRGLRRRLHIDSLDGKRRLCKTLLRGCVVRVELAVRSKGTWHGRSTITVLHPRPYLERTIMIGEWRGPAVTSQTTKTRAHGVYREKVGLHGLEPLARHACHIEMPTPGLRRLSSHSSNSVVVPPPSPSLRSSVPT